MLVKCLIHTALLVVLLLTCGVTQSQSYGLLFASTEVVQDKRTGLDLSPRSTICFKDNFDLSFELSVLPNRFEYFGYIVRIIENEKRNIDLIYDNSPNHFKLVIGEQLPNIVFNINSELFYRQWNRIQLKFDYKKKTLTFVSGANSYSQHIDIKSGACYKILFGANTYGNFQTTDVPPMKVRNISITEGSKMLHSWRLNEEEGNSAGDSIAGSPANVINPKWIRKLHHEWQLLKTISLDGPAAVAFNPADGVVQLIGYDSLVNYNTLNRQLTYRRYRSGRFNLLRGNEALYDTVTKKLYALYVDQRKVTSFDFAIDTWDSTFRAPVPITSNWAFNKFYSPADSSIYMIGGYGHFIYKNAVRKWNVYTGNWEVIKAKGDSLTPRYLASLGQVPGGAYILGGYGSATGQQILNPKNLYDLLYFNVADQSFKKIYDLPVKDSDFVFANSLVIDQKNNTYYGLVNPKLKYNSSLQLIVGSLKEPVFKTIGTSIPYTFHDAWSYADLFYCPLSESLVAVTLLHNENKQTDVAIYSLSFPPQELSTKPAGDNSDKLLAKYWYILLIIVALGMTGLWVAKRKKNKSVAKLQPAPAVIAIPAAEPTAPVKNAVFLFGDMQLFDGEGADITKFFTPLIKELFLALLLYTLRWDRGISSDKLKELLWFDKSEESARNNRSVNIVKLKSILDKMKFCEVSKDTGYWKVNIDYSQIQVDYREYLDIVKDKQKLNKQKIQQLAQITQRGGFLSADNYEWLDSFKSEISNEVIDTYLHFANSIKIAEDPEFLIKITNYIFYFDAVNEEAMIIKCRALVYLGKHSLAKNSFENFRKEYKVLYGEEFGRDFQEILS